MSTAHSQSSKANTRRCPRCRRRMKPLAMHCKNCDWKMPYRFLLQTLMITGVGLIFLGTYAALTKSSGSGGLNISMGKKAK